MNYNNRDISSKYCNLCLGNSLDTMDHLLRCPALAKEQIRLKENVIQRFNFWAIPYASIPQKQRELVLRDHWRSLARQHFSSAVIPDLRLDLLTSGFYKTNSSKQFISTRHFLQCLSQLVLKPTTSQYQLRQDFLSMLIQAFTLHTQGFTDSWNFSPLFGEWTSGNTFDIPFGCRLWSTETMHAGCNVLFFQPPDSSIKLQHLLELLAGSLESNAPTRFVIVIPKQSTLPKPFLELASLSPRCPLFSFEYSVAKVASPCEMSIILGANKQSMSTDPIDWELFVHKIQDWSQNWSRGLLKLNAQTDALFRERTHLPHPPRTLSKHPLTTVLNSIYTINFYDIFAPKTPLTRTNVIPSRATELIRKANQHPCFLGVLGILPNHLRTLLKELDHKDREESLLDISRTLFFAGFQLWTKRQKLHSHYWKEIAPANKKIRTPKRKKSKLDNASLQNKCTNLFHFLARHSNLSQQRPTKCFCRDVSSNDSRYIPQSITEFLHKFPITTNENGRSDPFHLFSSSRNHNFKTRTDAIMMQHDRGKKRKKSESIKSYFISC